MKSRNDKEVAIANRKKSHKRYFIFDQVGVSKSCLERFKRLVAEKYTYSIFKYKNDYLCGYLVARSYTVSTLNKVDLYIGESTSVTIEPTDEDIKSLREDLLKNGYSEVGDYTKIRSDGALTRKMNKRTLAVKNNMKIDDYFNKKSSTAPSSLSSTEEFDSDDDNEHWTICTYDEYNKNI